MEAMCIDHHGGDRALRIHHAELGTRCRGESPLRMIDGPGLVVDLSTAHIRDLDGARPATNSQLPGPADLKGERVNRRLNRNRLVKNHLVGVSTDLHPELLTVVVDQAPLLPSDEAPAFLIPSLQDNSPHDGVGAALLPQGTPKCLTDSQITSDAHSVIPELVTCWARRRLRTSSPTDSIWAGVSVRQLVSVT